MKKLLFALLALSFCSVGFGASAQTVLRFSTGVGSSSTFWPQLVRWMDKVEGDSKGAIKFDRYPDGMLSKFGNTLDAVANGVSDIGVDSPGLYGATYQGTMVTTLPGLYTDLSTAAEAYYNGWKKGILGQQLSAYKIIFIMPSLNIGYFLTSPPSSNTDLNNLKVATPLKQWAELSSYMGAVPVSILPSDSYGAIQKGVVSGIMTDVNAVAAFKLDELTNYYLTGPFGGGLNVLVLNKSKYDALSAEAKKAIDDNSGVDTWKSQAATFQAVADDYFAKMLKRPGTKLVALSDAEIAKWAPAFDKVSSGWVANTKDGQMILDTFKAEMAAVKAKK